MTQVTLPGEPFTAGRCNAQAKMDSITGAYQLVTLARRGHTEVEVDDLPTEAADVLDDLLWSVGDGNLPLADAAEQFALELPLGIEESATRKNCSDIYEYDHHTILLTIGGPVAWIEGRTDGLLAEVVYADPHKGEQRLSITALEREALEWFIALVAW